MAAPAARANVAMPNAALPGLLGIPPPKDDAILPAAAGSSTALVSPGNPACSSNEAKPNRAAASERWDAKPASSCSNKLARPGRADAAERWDAHKRDTSLGKRPISSASSWSDSWSSTRSNKKQHCAAPSAWKRKQEDDNRNGCKRPFFSGRSSSSEERWDAHKKPRAHGNGGVGGSDAGQQTGRNDRMKITVPHAGMGFLNAPEPHMLPLPAFKAVAPPYAGPSFLNSPDPSTLPLPEFVSL